MKSLNESVHAVTALIKAAPETTHHAAEVRFRLTWNSVLQLEELQRGVMSALMRLGAFLRANRGLAKRTQRGELP